MGSYAAHLENQLAEARRIANERAAAASKLIATIASLSERIAVLEAAGRKALRFIENTESEHGISLDSGDALRAALAPLGEAGR